MEFDTYSNSRHNWEFIATVMEHWEALAAAMPEVWARFRNSAMIAIELAKREKEAMPLPKRRCSRTPLEPDSNSTLNQ